MQFWVLGVAPVIAVSMTRVGVYVVLFATVVALGAKITHEVRKALEARPLPEPGAGGGDGVSSAPSPNETRTDEQAIDAAPVSAPRRDTEPPARCEPGIAEARPTTCLEHEADHGDASADEGAALAPVDANGAPSATEEPPRPAWAD